MKPNTPENFWNGVDVRGNDECWNWKRSCFSQGYGTVTYHQKQMKAHRLAWILTNGEIPDGMMLCHKCDNKKCCNPNHLFIGTAADNMADWKNKGLSRKGVDISLAKLDDEKVIELRKRFQAGKSYESLSKIFGINKPSCYKVVKGWTWAHLPLFPRVEWKDTSFNQSILTAGKGV